MPPALGLVAVVVLALFVYAVASSPRPKNFNSFPSDSRSCLPHNPTTYTRMRRRFRPPPPPGGDVCCAQCHRGSAPSVRGGCVGHHLIVLVSYFVVFNFPRGVRLRCAALRCGRSSADTSGYQPANSSAERKLKKIQNPHRRAKITLLPTPRDATTKRSTRFEFIFR